MLNVQLPKFFQKVTAGRDKWHGTDSEMLDISATNIKEEICANSDPMTSNILSLQCLADVGEDIVNKFMLSKTKAKKNVPSELRRGCEDKTVKRRDSSLKPARCSLPLKRSLPKVGALSDNVSNEHKCDSLPNYISLSKRDSLGKSGSVCKDNSSKHQSLSKKVTLIPIPEYTLVSSIMLLPNEESIPARTNLSVTPDVHIFSRPSLGDECPDVLLKTTDVDLSLLSLEENNEGLSKGEVFDEQNRIDVSDATGETVDGKDLVCTVVENYETLVGKKHTTTVDNTLKVMVGGALQAMVGETLQATVGDTLLATVGDSPQEMLGDNLHITVNRLLPATVGCNFKAAVCDSFRTDMTHLDDQAMNEPHDIVMLSLGDTASLGAALDECTLDVCTTTTGKLGFELTHIPPDSELQARTLHEESKSGIFRRAEQARKTENVRRPTEIERLLIDGSFRLGRDRRSSRNNPKRKTKVDSHRSSVHTSLSRHPPSSSCIRAGQQGIGRR